MMAASAIPAWAGNVSRETLAQLTRYVELLLKWNATINLVGKTTQADIWSRHIWDSYQLLAHVPHETKTLADLGSGAGLPGLILAIARPDMAVTLVERDQRKSAFLREAARDVSLGRVTVIAGDAQRLTGPFDVVTARAMAALDQLFAFSYPLLGANSICLFPKGENFAMEVAQARKHWLFDHAVIHSKTNEKAGIISVTKLKPVA